MVTLTGLWLRLSNNLPLVCPSLQPLRGGIARLEPCFQFNVQKQPVPGSSAGSLALKSYLEIRTGSHEGGRKSSGSTSSSTINSRKKGSHGDDIPDLLQSVMPSA